MSQRHILLLNDGTMILENEMNTMPINESGNVQTQSDQNTVYDDLRRIPLAILPEKCGMIWTKTGSPIFGVIFFTLCSIIICSFMTYELIIEFIFFMYVTTFVLVIFSFLIMKHYEPNTPRWFEIPFGKIGAWILSLFSLGIMAFISAIMVVELWIGLLVFLGFNALFVIYYFTVKKWLDKRNEYTAIDNQKVHKTQNDIDAAQTEYTQMEETQKLLD